MAYILSAQLDDDATARDAFARYQAYVESVRDELPPGALALATAPWYYDSRDHRAPHDARLERVEVAEAPAGPGDERGGGGVRRVTITVRLLGAYHDGHIELRYEGVTRYRIELAAAARRPAGGGGHRDWRYDEFRLASGGGVEHEIEWWGSAPTGTWLIEAADVLYRWLPIAEPSHANAAG